MLVRFLARGVNAVLFCVEEKRERKKSSGKRKVLIGKTKRYDNNYLQNDCFLIIFSLFNYASFRKKQASVAKEKRENSELWA